MDQFGTPPSTHKRRTKMWVAIILLDILLTGAVVYYIFFRPEPTPDLNVKSDQQVEGEPIDVASTDDMDAVEEKDPLIALMDQLLEETADVEDLEVSAEQRINISKPEHAKYTPLIFEDIGNWDPNKNQQSPDEPIKIPPDVIKYDDRWVAILGFMQPIKFDGRKVSHFMLVRNQALCCYGIPIGLTDWIDVPVADKPVELMMHLPVTVLGKLDINENRMNGEVVSLFSMKCDKVLPPGELP